MNRATSALVAGVRVGLLPSGPAVVATRPPCCHVLFCTVIRWRYSSCPSGARDRSASDTCYIALGAPNSGLESKLKARPDSSPARYHHHTTTRLSRDYHGGGNSFTYSHLHPTTTAALPAVNSSSASSGRPRSANAATRDVVEPSHAATRGITDCRDGRVRVAAGR